jgi:hypothetical protein
MRKSELIRRLEEIPGDPPVTDIDGNELNITVELDEASGPEGDFDIAMLEIR